ncbi:hypothetical protein METBIDRAFT_12868 [Metschnikowia bicuspidata var. bicuspidata NRRL YB-4993]|uniref:RraA-like protein n=1 Tax=Metschnikowia bicuspidata var. bicuspidata NRRL YB-4993 TaxID=869754 RepID=A0A1A0H6V7_9ASCO|nr:hypothetical protein METBIDRAFT_12868 [Metschnikowia bicuspidata var. bicuspidata NRRL YB-4993]OBA19829.1 hypothetical protein METBIDRAFT_12868 [Metschnikowia bicuspidata var. bicuspidata NRRL YB-4993]
MSVRTKLTQFTSCDISDALVNFGIKNGGFIPNLVQRSLDERGQNNGHVSVVGLAYTVLYAPKSDPRPAVSQSYIDEIPKDAVLVLALTEDQQLETSPYVTINNALYGGLLSTRAQYREAAGSVILGRIRDLAEHRSLGYAVWSYGVGTTAPGPVVKVVGINETVTVKLAGMDPNERMVIHPGDYIVADENGVVRIPIGHTSGPEAGISLNQVLDYIPRRVDADTHVGQDIKNGRGAAEAQKFWRGKI